MKHILITIALVFGVFAQGNAQDERTSIEDMQQQMEELHDQMMQFFQMDSMGNGGFFSMPFGSQFDTIFQFQSDSLPFGADGFNGFFRMMPFGDSEMDGFGIEDIFRSFGDMMQRFGEDGFSTMPPTLDDEEDALLPEERLRMEEGKRENGKKTDNGKKRKTVKI